MEQETNRDLRWLIGSAPLFRGGEMPPSEAPIVPTIWPDRSWYREQLRELDCQTRARASEPVMTRFQNRLGRYAEQLVEQWLQQGPRVRKLSRGKHSHPRREPQNNFG